MMLAACSGGAAGRAARADHSSATSSSSAPSTTAPSTWPYDRVQPPHVIEYGEDVGASVRSLLAYGAWLAAHHPDPALIELAYAPGSPPFNVMQREVAELRRRRERLVEIDRAPFGVEIISLDPNVVSFRLTEHLAHRDVVDSKGRMISGEPAATEHYLVSMVRSFSDQPWRLNLVERERPKIEVQL